MNQTDRDGFLFIFALLILCVSAGIYAWGLFLGWWK